MRRLSKETLWLLAAGFALLALALHPDLAFAALRRVAQVTRPLAAGLLLALALDVPARFLERRVLHRRTPAVLLTALLAPGALALLIRLAAPQIAQSLSLIGTRLPSYAATFSAWAAGLAEKLGVPAPAAGRLAQTLSVPEKLAAAAAGVAGTLAKAAGAAAAAMVAYIFGIYVLLRKKQLLARAERLHATFTTGGVCDKLYTYCRFFARAFQSFAAGQVLEALLLGALCFLGMRIIRLPYAGLISALVGVTGLIPVLGAWIGAVPAVLLLLLENPVQALAFAVFLAALQQFEGSVLYPRVVGDAVGVDGLLVFAGVALGAGFGGLLGVIVAVPATAVLSRALDALLEKREKETEKRGKDK